MEYSAAWEESVLNAPQQRKNKTYLFLVQKNKQKTSHVNERTSTIETKQARLHLKKKKKKRGGGATKLSFISKCFPQPLPAVIAVLHF